MKGRAHMSNIGKRAEGAVEELGGTIKQTVGKVIGNKRMEAEGNVGKVRGQAKQAAAKVAERVKGRIDKLKVEARRKVNR